MLITGGFFVLDSKPPLFQNIVGVDGGRYVAFLCWCSWGNMNS